MNKYIFNFDNDPNLPPYEEENMFYNHYIKIATWNLSGPPSPWQKPGLPGPAHFYYWIVSSNEVRGSIIKIPEDIVLCLISTNNSAHSLSELISFINFYKKYETNKIGLYSDFVKKLPFLYQLLKIFIPEDKIILLKPGYSYKFDKIITHRNQHFNGLKICGLIKFEIVDNIIHYNYLEDVPENFLINGTNEFLNTMKDIYNNHKHKYILFDNIMLVKTSKDKDENKNISSPNRCMNKIDDKTVDILNNHNIKILSLDDFSDIYEYICVFYNAKNIIVSYGGSACTNRFFCNPDANIILIANLHYKDEYDLYNTDTSKKYWHIAFSHIYPAKKQTVLLDFENYIDESNVYKILNYLC
jgi:hypothetical protein